jgi:hypothetical protein
MGYMRHHAIVVTGWESAAVKAREAAYDIACDVEEMRVAQGPILHVTELSPLAMNGYRSFLVCPDGSKELWADSEFGDLWRARFIDWLKADGGVSWAEVQFGDDGGDNRLLRSS